MINSLKDRSHREGEVLDMWQTWSLKTLPSHQDSASEAFVQRLLQQLGWESPQAGLEMFPGLAAQWMFTCRADDRSCHW